MPLGRTLQLVKSIPASGAIVVVHSAKIQKHYEAMIARVRGGGVAENCRVVTVRSVTDANNALTGAAAPILVDHAFARNMGAVTATVEHYAETVARMFAAPRKPTPAEALSRWRI